MSHPFETRHRDRGVTCFDRLFPSAAKKTCVLVTFSFRKAASSSGGSILPGAAGFESDRIQLPAATTKQRPRLAFMIGECKRPNLTRATARARLLARFVQRSVARGILRFPFLVSVGCFYTLRHAAPAFSLGAGTFVESPSGQRAHCCYGRRGTSLCQSYYVKPSQKGLLPRGHLLNCTESLCSTGIMCNPNPLLDAA